MTAEIAVLHVRDRLQQDCEPVVAIYRDLGPVQAEQIIARVLGELALTMSGLAVQVRAHRLQDMSRQLRRLQRLSEQLGLLSLGAVAGDVRLCLDQGDPTAFSAVWARLLRVAERSLAADHSLIDRSV